MHNVGLGGKSIAGRGTAPFRGNLRVDCGNSTKEVALEEVLVTTGPSRKTNSELVS